MKEHWKARAALISAYHKEELGPLLDTLAELGVQLIASGGTAAYIRARGHEVAEVADLTSYPSILDGRVKTLHPAVFGGLLADRDKPEHMAELEKYDLPPIDLVVADLYPFVETLLETTDEAAIIENIDIGGPSLIRAAAKNFRHTAVVPSRAHLDLVNGWLRENDGALALEQRRHLAREAFLITSAYETAIAGYFTQGPVTPRLPLRYGENPHQEAYFDGDLTEIVTQHSGKPLSYNNILDLDAALRLWLDASWLKEGEAMFGVFKHTVPCGLAVRDSAAEAWNAALSCDPVSAFGGALFCNRLIDLTAARLIDDHFYELLVAPEFAPEALDLLSEKPNRILLTARPERLTDRQTHTMLNGELTQHANLHLTQPEHYETVTRTAVPGALTAALRLGELAVKHLKSNAIALVKEGRLIGAGTGQTSRVDAWRQALQKARTFGFDPAGAALCSDGFFPFNDIATEAAEAGIGAILQPGGSKRDQESIDACDAAGLPMVFTRFRSFRH